MENPVPVLSAIYSKEYVRLETATLLNPSSSTGSVTVPPSLSPGAVLYTTALIADALEHILSTPVSLETRISPVPADPSNVTAVVPVVATAPAASHQQRSLPAYTSFLTTATTTTTTVINQGTRITNGDQSSESVLRLQTDHQPGEPHIMPTEGDLPGGDPQDALVRDEVIQESFDAEVDRSTTPTLASSHEKKQQSTTNIDGGLSATLSYDEDSEPLVGNGASSDGFENESPRSAGVTPFGEMYDSFDQSQHEWDDDGLLGSRPQSQSESRVPSPSPRTDSKHVSPDPSVIIHPDRSQAGPDRTGVDTVDEDGGYIEDCAAEPKIPRSIAYISTKRERGGGEEETVVESPEDFGVSPRPDLRTSRSMSFDASSISYLHRRSRSSLYQHGFDVREHHDDDDHVVPEEHDYDSLDGDFTSPRSDDYGDALSLHARIADLWGDAARDYGDGESIGAASRKRGMDLDGNRDAMGGYPYPYFQNRRRNSDSSVLSAPTTFGDT
ncbi:hypothetical protein HK102_013572, partial [Quaeritorhiza haematococci]